MAFRRAGMSSESNYKSAYALADRIIGSLLDSASTGLVLSVDFGGSMFDFIAQSAANSAGHEFARFPSLTRYHSQLNDLGLSMKTADALAEPVLFGRIDGIIRSQNDDEIFEEYARRFVNVATRGIDSWLVGRPKPRLIHFGDPNLLLDQMAGAAEALAKHRPIITLYSAGQDRGALLSQLHEYGYRAFDLAASPVRQGGTNSAVDFGWIAIAEEQHSDLFSHGETSSDDADSAFSEWQQELDQQHEMNRYALPRQWRSRRVFGLPAGASFQIPRKIAAEEIVAFGDCYPVETNGTQSWRWLGPRPRTRFALPCPLPGIYQAQIQVLDSHLLTGLSNCRVLVEGREVRSTSEGSREGVIRFVGRLDARDYTGHMEIDIVTSDAVSPVSDEPRTLRLSIQSITISPWR